nr:hypothetical protein [Tanacetum cinerariifolium]
MKLQALIDRKKVIMTEDTIRQNLRLDDADGIDCLPNKDIFAEFARMGYEKPKFWSSVSIKKSNDVMKLQALIDRKKVIMTEDTIRQNLRLDDADGIDCLPNKDIFAEFARMGYEKPSTKLPFYKVFFSDLVRNVDSSKFLMYPQFLQVMINAQVDDLSSHNTKYTSTALTWKVFANIRRIVQEDEDDEVPVAPTPPSPTPTTTPPPPQQETIPSPRQAQSVQPSSLPQQQPQAA